MLSRDILTPEPAISSELLSEEKACIPLSPGISLQDLYLKYHQTPFTCEKHAHHLQSLRNLQSIYSWLDYTDIHEYGRDENVVSPFLSSSDLFTVKLCTESLVYITLYCSNKAKQKWGKES